MAVMMAGMGYAIHRGGAGARAMEQRLLGLVQRSRETPNLQVERDVRCSSIGWLDAVLRRLDISQQLEMQLYQAGMSMRVGALFLLMGSFGVAGYIVGLMLTHRVAPGLILMGIAAPVPYLNVKYRKHQ